jgi:hypothetical protein
MAERREIKLTNGTVLHQLSNEDRLYGFLAVEASGRVRIWNQVWHDEFTPSNTVFPGFVSAARALISGEV